jgi:hypothetical protein
MPIRIDWTEQRDEEILRLRGEGASWDRIAAVLGVGRNAAIDRGRRLGAHLPDGDRARPITAACADELDDPNRPPLPAGHPLAWSILTDGTLLAGTSFRAPTEAVAHSAAKRSGRPAGDSSGIALRG